MFKENRFDCENWYSTVERNHISGCFVSGRTTWRVRDRSQESHLHSVTHCWKRDATKTVADADGREKNEMAESSEPNLAAERVVWTPRKKKRVQRKETNHHLLCVFSSCLWHISQTQTLKLVNRWHDVHMAVYRSFLGPFLSRMAHVVVKVGETQNLYVTRRCSLAWQEVRSPVWSCLHCHHQFCWFRLNQQSLVVCSYLKQSSSFTPESPGWL